MILAAVVERGAFLLRVADMADCVLVMLEMQAVSHRPTPAGIPGPHGNDRLEADTTS
jgi:hypothetical protein